MGITSFQSMVPGVEMGVGFAVVVVDVEGADARAHEFELGLDAAHEVGVAGVEAKAEVEVGLAEEEQQALGGGEGVGDVFEEDFDAAVGGEETQFIETGEGVFEFALVEVVDGGAEVLDEETEGDEFGDFEGALDFVAGGDAAGLVEIGDVDDGAGAGAAPDVVVVHGGVEGVEAHAGVGEPMFELVDLGFVVVVEVLAGAEDFNGGDAGVEEFV
jgi:hypothetical protein